jgi:hypothetical protein
MSKKTILALLGIFSILISCEIVDAPIEVIPKELTLTYPNGDEVLYGSSEKNITWNSTEIDSILIEVSYNNAIDSTWDTLATVSAKEGRWLWQVPDTSSEQCYIKLSDSNGELFDLSNNSFEINRAAPHGTVMLISPIYNDTTDITPTFAWSIIEVAPDFQLQISKNGFVNMFESHLVYDINTSELSHKCGISLEDSTSYYWRVSSFNESGHSDWSKIDTFYVISD